MEEKRKSARIVFTGDDAIYGVLERADSDNKIVTLPISDISEKGGKFHLDLNSDEKFSNQEKLWLKAIIGARNVKFDDPIELVIRWQVTEDATYFFGCELASISKESMRKFLALIQSERGFSEIWRKGRKGGLTGRGELTPEESPENPPIAGEEKSEPSPGATTSLMPTLDGSMSSRVKSRRYSLKGKQPYHMTFFVIAGLIGYVLLFLSLGYTLRTREELFHRIRQLEKEIFQLTADLSTGENAGGIEAAIRSLEDTAASLSEFDRKSNEVLEQLSDKIDRLDEKTGAIEKRLEKEVVFKQGVATPPQREAKAEAIFHVVKPGDNLFRISMKYNVLLEKLAEINGISPDDILSPGQRLIIPQ